MGEPRRRGGDAECAEWILVVRVVAPRIARRDDADHEVVGPLRALRVSSAPPRFPHEAPDPASPDRPPASQRPAQASRGSSKKSSLSIGITSEVTMFAAWLTTRLK